MRVELLKLPPISHSALQEWLQDLQAIEIQMPGKAPVTPDSIILGDDLEYKVITRETLADRVSRSFSTFCITL